MAQTVMFQGTASHVGKSWLATALCRILVQDGYKVLPFKSQNMALNSYVTPEGGEIGRAQALQALAARTVPRVDMNPILLKPKADTMAQVVVMGKPIGDMGAWDYRSDYMDMAVKIVAASLERLMQDADIVVIEGAGSPAEINLKDREIVNMRIAKLAKAPVLLVADIDRGGVFASIIGTLELLEPWERAVIKGLIINKFRGDKRILDPGLEFLAERTGIPILGVIPHSNVCLEQEDSVSLEGVAGWLHHTDDVQRKGEIDIAVIHLPHISNFTDFDPLAMEPTVTLRYIKDSTRLGKPDVVIVPGTKNTVHDLHWLKQRGFSERLLDLWTAGQSIVGICGGYQMMGTLLKDVSGIEDRPGEYAGLGLLPIHTTFFPDKKTCLVAGKMDPELTEIWGGGTSESPLVKGYEIHMGRTEYSGSSRPLFRLTREEDVGDGGVEDGVYSADGRLFGTYLHGLFENGQFRWLWLNFLRRRKGLPELTAEEGALDYWEVREKNLDQWARVVRQNLDIAEVMAIIRKGVLL